MWKTILLLGCALVVHAQQFDCPDPWQLFGTKCYWFVGYPRRNYVGASQTCQKDGATLVSVNNDAEHNFIVNWLDRNDQRRDNWYTSGVVVANVESRIMWGGDSTNPNPGMNYWLDLNDRNREGRRVVYKFSGIRYGWGVLVTEDEQSFICEIERSNVYKILRENRGFDYGLAIFDPNRVPRGPYFLQEPIDTTILGSTTAVFLDCVAVGVSTPRYTWVKLNGSREIPITPQRDNRFTLTNGRFTISRPVKEDEGDYQCKANNEFGTILSNSIQLSFGELGNFSNVAVAPLVANEFEGTQMECPPIPAKPAKKYQWYKNSIANFVRPSLQSYIFISNNGRLYFSEVTNQDEANYHCVVALASIGDTGNYIGASQAPMRASLGFRLVVNSQAGGDYQPVIGDDFIAVYPGQPMRHQTIILECFAYGTGPLQYSWRRYGKALPKTARFEDHNRKMVIERVEVEDEGKYNCFVKSSKTGLSQNKNYTLRVEAKPYFTFPLQHQHVDIGSQLTWHCEAAGRPAPTYRWLKDGQPMNNISGAVIVQGNTLRIQQVNQKRDGGMYQCLATNIYGTSFSTAQLRVLEFKPSFTKTPLDKSIAASLGGNVTIVCNPEAAPFPTFTWLKDGRNLGLSMGSASGNLQMLMNGNLFIQGVRQADRGRYTCKVENNIGAAEDSGFLEIYEQTRVTRRPSPERVHVNNSATLICEASHNPSVDMVYTWEFNNHPIDVTTNIYYSMGTGYMNSGYLHIRNAQFFHQGRYKCVVFTSLDKDSAETYLTVEGPPGEPAGVFYDATAQNLPPRAVKLMWTDGETHGANIIYYNIEFRTNFNMKWRILKERIPATLTIDSVRPDKRMTTVENLKPGASYFFRVRATNIFGTGIPSLPTSSVQIPGDRPYVAPARVSGGGGKVGTLRIYWEPLPPEDHNGNNVGYNVLWRPKPLQGSESRWEQREIPGADSNEFVTTVGRQNYYMQYEVRVQAYNEFGKGNMSHIALVYSAEDLPTATPRTIKAYAFNSTALVVHWDPVKNDRQNMKGSLIGYKINYWLDGKESEIDAKQNILQGQIDHGLIIGLQPDTWYKVNVQVYNDAGNGPKSEDFRQSTDQDATGLYPTEVHVYSHTGESVLVNFRGVSSQAGEETLKGYRILYWRLGEDIRKAKHVDVGKSSQGIIERLEKGIVYQLRVFGYSRAGQGKMSSPETYFTLGGQLRYDPESTEVLASSSRMTPAVVLVCLCLFFSMLQRQIS